nr:DUF4097 family beta strand repeat-containing protein [Kofleriaceae bacterium]
MRSFAIGALVIAAAATPALANPTTGSASTGSASTAATGSATTATTADGVTERDRVDVAPSGHAFKQLSIDNPLGDVTVEGYDGTTIRIETHKHAPDEDALDRLRVSLVPSDDGTVRITTTADPKDAEGKVLRRGAVRVDLVIRAPRDLRVDANVNAGKLDISGMENGGDLDAATGPITVRHVSGALYTHTVSGATNLSEVSGSVDAQSLASDVQLDTVSGEKLVASVDKGKIGGRRVRSRDIELTSTDGPIALEAEATLRGRIRVASLRGDLEVRLHRHGTALLVRATGAKVDLGAAAQQERAAAAGWHEAAFGDVAAAEAAAIELRSRYGNVVFAIVE